MLSIGLMSGTSMDAIDVALVEYLGPGCRVLNFRQFPIPLALQQELRRAGPATRIDALLELDARVGALFAECASTFMKEAGVDPPDISVIGSHGQTLLHVPGTPWSNTLQIGDPNRIAWVTGLRTVADFRRMDMAAGGQGAPLASAFHAALLAGTRKPQVILNIGGIANISIIQPGEPCRVTGFDTGPGNTLMDQWAQQTTGAQYDAGGGLARSGKVHEALLGILLGDTYFEASPPKSTGREYFNLEWLSGHGGKLLASMSVADVQATLLALSVETIAIEVSRHAAGTESVSVCGGGARNAFLMQTLAQRLAPIQVGTTESMGVMPEAMEAAMIAWLACCRLRGEPGNLPSVTGADGSVVLGAIYEPRANDAAGTRRPPDSDRE